jgi:hypothetical protein
MFHSTVGRNDVRGEILHLFKGSSASLETREAAAVRAECTIPAACGVYYYEVTVLDRGNKGCVSLRNLICY